MLDLENFYKDNRNLYLEITDDNNGDDGEYGEYGKGAFIINEGRERTAGIQKKRLFNQLNDSVMYSLFVSKYNANINKNLKFFYVSFTMESFSLKFIHEIKLVRIKSK